MENTEILYLGMVLFTCYAFNLAQGLRVAINRGDTVRIVPKLLCSIYCISASLIGALIVPSSLSLFIYFHLFVILFQLAMVWFPKPKE